MAEYTDLSASNIEQLFRQFQDVPVTSSKRLPGGRANSSFLIETHTGKFVLTVCDAKDRQESEGAVRLLELMAKAGLATPRVYRTREGKAVTSHQGRPVVLKRFQPGEVQRDLSDPHLRRVGGALARLHELTPPSELADQFSYGLQTFHEVIDRHGSGEFGVWLQNRFQALSHLDDLDLPRGLIHGDLFWDNIVVLDDSITLLDFEEACHYTLAFDLGMTMVGCCFSAEERWLDRASALLEGYQEHRELGFEERQNLQSFAVYGATATACWRFWQYNINLPNSLDRNAYKEMQTLADRIATVDEAEFLSRIR